MEPSALDLLDGRFVWVGANHFFYLCWRDLLPCISLALQGRIEIRSTRMYPHPDFVTTALIINVGLAYLETFRRSPDAGPFSIEYGGFVDVARINEAIHVLNPVFLTPRLSPRLPGVDICCAPSRVSALVTIKQRSLELWFSSPCHDITSISYNLGVRGQWG